ncbi:hypothetical protein BLOT_013346 [Blomia tropicalis]|nr:hypothetical protein BLOT_013346 [Blomia tropicalis]
MWRIFGDGYQLSINLRNRIIIFILPFFIFASYESSLIKADQISTNLDPSFNRKQLNQSIANYLQIVFVDEIQHDQNGVKQKCGIKLCHFVERAIEDIIIIVVVRTK